MGEKLSKTDSREYRDRPAYTLTVDFEPYLSDIAEKYGWKKAELHTRKMEQLFSDGIKAPVFGRKYLDSNTRIFFPETHQIGLKRDGFEIQYRIEATEELSEEQKEEITEKLPEYLENNYRRETSSTWNEEVSFEWVESQDQRVLRPQLLEEN